MITWQESPQTKCPFFICFRIKKKRKLVFINFIELTFLIYESGIPKEKKNGMTFNKYPMRIGKAKM